MYLATILLLMRKRLAFPLYIISFIGATISSIWVMTTPAAQDAGGQYYWVMPVLIFVIGLSEIWYSRKKAGEGVLS